MSILAVFKMKKGQNCVFTIVHLNTWTIVFTFDVFVNCIIPTYLFSYNSSSLNIISSGAFVTL